MGKSLDELRAEATALQGDESSRKKSKSTSPSPSPGLEEWEKQIVEIDRAKKSKPHMYHTAIVKAINTGTDVSIVMERFSISTRTIKTAMRIHNQQADKNNDKAI